MNVGIYLRTDAPDQHAVAEAVREGCRIGGERPFIFSDHQQIATADVVVLFGIGGDAKAVWDAAKRTGKRLVLLDKPYIRQWKSTTRPRYWLLRVAVDAFQPLNYFQRVRRSPDRWNALDIAIKPYGKRDHVSLLATPAASILFDGASNKYVAWNALGNGVGTDLDQWAEWGQRMVDRIGQYTTLPIKYRPRPSKNQVPSIRGALVSTISLEHDFALCDLVVSHGGNIGYDAVVAGIPHFAIGDSIARPLSETEWRRIQIPVIPPEDVRSQWLADIAWCQWNLDEFRAGAAWAYIRETMEIINGLR